MKKMMIIAAVALFSALFFSGLFSIAEATPHRMYIDYEVKKIDIRVYYGGGTPAREADVKVYEPDGSLYLEGETDDEGRFSFEPAAMEGDWKIVAEHSGHRAEVDLTGGSGGTEMPLYTRIIAGFGYLIGVAGLAIGYMGWRARRKRESGRVS